MPFNFKRLEIPDVVLIKLKPFGDNRGFFMETYKESDFSAFGIRERFLQDNHSRSVAKGTIRGLHFQKEPRAQAKLIRAVQGSAFDVAVDMRRSSPTFGRWVSAVLSADNKEMLYVPKGFAHGFCTLEENTELIYKCSGMYSPEHESGVAWNDPDIGIKWPADKAILSERDKKWPVLKKGHTYE